MMLSAGYGSGPWAKWGFAGDTINLFLRTTFPTFIGDNKFLYFVDMMVPPDLLPHKLPERVRTKLLPSIAAG
jgi:hypothetical protein